MAKRRSARIFLVLMIGTALVALPAAAAAAPGPTPNGWVGACNMMLAGDGMDNAMVRNTTQGTHGNDGMFRAVDVSGGCL